MTFILVALNAVMLVVCVAVAGLGVRTLARARRAPTSTVIGFLSASSIVSAALFGYGVLLIGMTPLIYGACQ